MVTEKPWSSAVPHFPLSAQGVPDLLSPLLSSFKSRRSFPVIEKALFLFFQARFQPAFFPATIFPPLLTSLTPPCFAFPLFSFLGLFGYPLFHSLRCPLPLSFPHTLACDVLSSSFPPRLKASLQALRPLGRAPVLLFPVMMLMAWFKASPFAVFSALSKVFLAHPSFFLLLQDS